MPKRKNPFDDSFLLQNKAHIGIREINLGVNKAHNMKTVYDKTHELLFSGASKAFSSSSLKQTVGHLNEKNSANTDLKKCCQLKGLHSKCTFCETRICTDCMQICAVCNEKFCHLCSLMQYQTPEEAAVCLSCL